MSPQNPLFFSLFFFFFFLLLFFTVSTSSLDQDRLILLSFKSNIHDPSNSLSSWTYDSPTTTPCSWLGVTCNPSTRRVTKLVLEDLDLTGPIDALTNLTQLRVLSLKNNGLTNGGGNLNFSLWHNIKHVYLSHNRFSGNFPAGVSGLRHLQRLDLSYNGFSGLIPLARISGLGRLLTLRLEVNSFSGFSGSVGDGPISIVDFNVSGNSLSGDIPTSLAGFPVTSFAGNENLCGKPLLFKCSNQTVKSEPAQSKQAPLPKKRLGNWVVVMIVGVDVVAVVAAVATVMYCCYYRRKRNRDAHEQMMTKKQGFYSQKRGFYGGGGEGEEMMVFEGCKGFGALDDLLKSSAELLGKGSVGTTYKVVMDGGEVAVVKRVRERRKKREVNGWLKLIGGLRHPNVVSLRAFFNAKDELLLVYDFLPNGSLHYLLHGNRGPGRTPLEWTTRLKLASDSAHGLAFLHAYNKAKLFHGNLTSSNIIVDRLGNACISDIGLHQILHSHSFSNSAYMAPELMPNTNNSNITQRKFTQKCDVYSFGVILLEILTGKMPNGDGETSLVKWVQKVGREEWTWEVFDFELLRYKDKEEEMVALMQVALLCLAPLPRDRPKMNMVQGMIDDIRTKGSSGGRPSSIMNDLSCDSSPSVSEKEINFNSHS